jgi:uncharacterized DUF497 family protein
MFEWDEAKRIRTLAERGLDFIDAALAFDGRQALHIPARHDGEERLLTVAMLGGKFHAVIWTWRGANRRIISFPRARDVEERLHDALFHG